MLFYTTVSQSTLAILKSIMSDPTFDQFNLVGGTALSLQIGHRLSIDLDLFGIKSLDQNRISTSLSKLGNLTENSKSEIFYGVFLDELKIDFLEYPYPQYLPTVEIDGIRMLSKLEISAMKLSAIGSRGTKKDYVDIYFLLKEFSLKQMLDAFSTKYPIQNNIHAFKSLTYFDDAEKTEMPTMLNDTTWDDIKAGIIKHVQKFKF
jgi:predicted nucleotidyltransferase component of viral defense system